ncbi:MAG: DUF1697 domain-containing protein [Myxococcales bacterium]|nr:DUF1697 domain-containing protein [Myxococcales bacterium]
MTRSVALLRGINVGGSGRLPMADLRSICEALGLRGVETYIQSGNVVFEPPDSLDAARDALAAAVSARVGKPVPVATRTVEELESIAAASPFGTAPADRVIVWFWPNSAPAAARVAEARGRRDEEIWAGAREWHVHYPQGQGQTKLRLPDEAAATGRNLKTVAALLELARRGSVK